MIRLLAACALGTTILASFGSTQKNARPPAGVTLFPTGIVFRSFEEYRQRLHVDARSWSGEPIRSAEFEIRNSDSKRVHRWPYLHRLHHEIEDTRPGRLETTTILGFPDAALDRIGRVEPGDYRIALHLNGVRSSNVISVRIDPHFVLAESPVFQLRSLEPHPFGEHAVPILYAVGPETPPDRFTNLALYSAPLIIGGKERSPELTVWTGPVGPVSTGDRYAMTFDLSRFAPELDLSKKHIFLFRYAGYESAPFEADLSDHMLARQWDEEVPGDANQAADELYPGHSKDLALLRATHQIPAGANSKEVLTVSTWPAIQSAERFFTKVPMLFKSRDEVLAMLGDPVSISDYGVEVKSGKDADLVYVFDTGFGGVKFTLEFRNDQVWGIRAVGLD